MPIQQFEQEQCRKRDALRVAISEQVMPLFCGRVLNFDVSGATAFSDVIVAANAVGNDIDFADAAIAATAIANRFLLATRNVRDFRGIEVEIFDPWAQAN